MYRLFCLFVKLTGAIPAALVFRTKVLYEDKKVQKRFIRGSAIVAANHNSVWDFATLMFVFWSRTLRCVVAELMFEKNLFMNAFLRMLGCIKVDRNSHDFAFVERGKKILSDGGVVEIYPEARIPEKDEKKPLPFKPSAVYLALESGSPIVPVHIRGKYFSRERIRVMIGKPIDVRELYDSALSEKENIAKITEFLRGKIIELGEQIQK